VHLKSNLILKHSKHFSETISSSRFIYATSYSCLCFTWKWSLKAVQLRWHSSGSKIAQPSQCPVSTSLDSTDLPAVAETGCIDSASALVGLMQCTCWNLHF